jgi:hypothetical protein
MTAIWQNNADGWNLLAPAGFPSESDLHGLVEQTPELLPLAGSPRLTILGREVSLGGNLADLIAIDDTGRLVIIEIKLFRNAEARRAVIAQILTYAAFLRGISVDALESRVLGTHFTARGYSSLIQAVRANDQSGGLDETAFQVGLTDCLKTGHFRLVLVLDDAPPELVRLVGYLESIAEGLAVDLITVASFQVGGSQIVIPRRIASGEMHIHAAAADATAKTDDTTVGSGEFRRVIADSPEAHRSMLLKLADWADALQAEGLVNLLSFRGKNRSTLLPRLRGPEVGLVTIWNDGGPYLSFWRSVFEKYAPRSLPQIEALVPTGKVGQGNTTKVIDDSLLLALTNAYREAASGKIEL